LVYLVPLCKKPDTPDQEIDQANQPHVPPVPPSAIVLDLFNREVVGGSLKPRMTADIVTDTLPMAWFRRKPAVGLLASLGSGQPIRQPTFSGHAEGLRHGGLHESQGELLG
jgi:transposase InsO family protein